MDRNGLQSDHPRDRPLSPALLARVFHQPSLVYFNAVCETLSMREAGRRLNVASSAISRQIVQLEDALGMALFTRDGRRLSLTAAGGILFRHSRRLAAPLEAAVSELDMLRGLKAGTVRVAAVESVGVSFLPLILAEFARDYPRLQLDVTIASSHDVVSRVLRERADLGFGFLIGPTAGIELAVRRDVRIGVLCHPRHPLAEGNAVTVAACAHHPLALAKRDLSIHALTAPYFESTPPRFPPLEADSIRVLVELALIGHHAAIMTPIGVQDEIASGTLAFRPLRDKGLPTNRFGLMVRAGMDLGFAPAVFMEHAKRHLGRIEFPG